MTQLPPKRFQSIDDPLYDSIRYNPWFRDLETRRAKIPALVFAKHLLDKNQHMSQQEAAATLDVDSRELRDFINFCDNRSRFEEIQDKAERAVMQAILDAAYRTYVALNGKHSLRDCLSLEAKAFGANPRHVTELWDIDPRFYPTNYKQ